MRDKYSFTSNELNAFIASWLNEDNSNYVKYVKGVKLFIEYLDELNEQNA